MTPSPVTKQRPAHSLSSRLKDMWDLGLKHAATIIPIVAVVLIFLLYSWDILKEGFVGTLVALAFTLGPLAMAIPNATSQAQAKGLKIAVYALGLVWLVGFGFPVYHVLFPPKAVAERTLEKGKPVTVDVGGSRRLEVVARGGFPAEMVGSAKYKLVVESGAVKEKVEGTFERTWQHVRVGRRGGMARQLVKHLTNVHQIPKPIGPQVTLHLEDVDTTLVKAVQVALRPAGLPPWLFIALCCVVLAWALFMDLFFEHLKKHTYLFIAAVFGAVFAYNLPDSIGDQMVRGTIGAGIIAILWAGIGGFLLIWLLRLMFFSKKRQPVRRG